MPHFELMYPSKYLKSSDLRGQDVHLTIASIEVEELKRAGTDKVETKPILYFEETAKSAKKNRTDEKRLVLNITNARVVAGLYGTDTDQWIGNRITVYSTSVSAFGKTTDAIRIRENRPPSKGKPAPPAPPVDDDIPFGDDPKPDRETYDLAAHCKTCGGSYQTGAPVNARTGTCDGCVDGEADANMLAIDAIKLGDADMIGQGE